MINVDKYIEYILDYKNFEGEFKDVSGVESHAAYRFCAIWSFSCY